MINTIEILERKYCTGCTSCFNCCPTKAISMQLNDEGFLYPQIDHELCVNCGLCVKSCPELEKNFYEKKEVESYAICGINEVREKSSSGGMFTILAEYVLEKEGYVCGAAWDVNLNVKHTMINDRNSLDTLRGSKYLQSELGNSYIEIKKKLCLGKTVLFSGCPCQVAGLYSFLNDNNIENLITIDIVCHGVPSPKVFQHYLEEKKSGREISKFDFREKKFWGWGTASSIFFKDGSAYRNDCYNDEYWIAFLEGFSTRECCGECPYANINRISDLTLGDFWGIADLSPEMDDNKGTSLVIANTNKGKELLELLKNNFYKIKKIEIQDVIETAKKRNGQLIGPKNHHWARKRFFDLINIKTVKESLDFSKNSKYDIGILGWWYNENYGGTLTYFALHQVFVSMGLSVLMIAKCSQNENYKPNLKSVPYKFAIKNYNISKNYTPENIEILNNHCKIFVSGSDQLFNPYLWEYSGPQYFLDFVSKENKLISYASSFGNKFDDSRNLKNRMGYWLSRFDFISAREDYGVDIFKETFDLDAKKVMDPVFLCDISEYKKLVNKSTLKKENNFFVSFYLDPDKEKRDLVLFLSEKLGLPYINLLNATDAKKNAEKLSLENTKPDISIEDWLFYYWNAEYIVTDSFHGTCFAIIFRKNFISIANHKRGENRFISLLNEVGLIDRLVFDINDISNKPNLFQEIDYLKVYERIEPKIKDSFNWLENAVKNNSNEKVNLFSIINSEIEKLKKDIAKLKKNKMQDIS